MFKILSVVLVFTAINTHAMDRKVFECKNGDAAIYAQDSGRYYSHYITIKGSVLDALVEQEPEAFDESRNNADRFYRENDSYVQSGTWFNHEFRGINGRAEYMYTLSGDHGGMVLTVFWNSNRAYEKARYYFHPGECR